MPGQGKNVIMRNMGEPEGSLKGPLVFLKARFRCLHLKGGSLYYSPKKVCQIVVACCMLHNLALGSHVPFLQKEETGDAPVASEDSEDEEAEDEDVDNRASVIRHATVCTANGLPPLNVRRGDLWVIM
ncbi:hypothetical protein NDU88_004694 [Pleurodeles waltl]|uniref:DDE Tnp4 domain-containing protein n=1 Tax=Pleurodeles waltl TaxID=8319 RepID=A0AAV7NK69_PLEWA|nr:hypothetical protein NDU88_004694 [Pleurodeles waltl]